MIAELDVPRYFREEDSTPCDSEESFHDPDGSSYMSYSDSDADRAEAAREGQAMAESLGTSGGTSASRVRFVDADGEEIPLPPKPKIRGYRSAAQQRFRVQLTDLELNVQSWDKCFVLRFAAPGEARSVNKLYFQVPELTQQAGLVNRDRSVEASRAASRAGSTVASGMTGRSKLTYKSRGGKTSKKPASAKQSAKTLASMKYSRAAALPPPAPILEGDYN